jgi:membrane-bound metal-dependent hydrolase YbcI (DUF457 family)
MDKLSHALWGYAATGRKSKFWLAAFFGAFPDLFAFTVPFTLAILTGNFSREGHHVFFPEFIRTLYNISHSILICALVFGIIYTFRKKIYLFMIGWPLHILLDIPTHEAEFYPTQFLYPLSTISVDGIRWSTPWIFITNWVLLALVYGYLFRIEIKNLFVKKKKSKKKNKK